MTFNRLAIGSFFIFRDFDTMVALNKKIDAENYQSMHNNRIWNIPLTDSCAQNKQVTEILLSAFKETKQPMASRSPGLP